MTIRKQGRRHVVESAGLRLTWDEARFAWAIERGRKRWSTAEPSPDALVVKDRALAKTCLLALQSARRIRTTAFANAAQEGLVCEAADFRGLPRGGRLKLTLTLAVESATGDLVIGVDGEAEGLFLSRLCWPGAIRFEAPGDQETVMPFMQGVLIPGSWPQAIPTKHFPTQGRGLYMPWWGQRDGHAGYLAVLETDADAGCRFEHPAGGPTRVGPCWFGSLGSFSYPRTVRYSFFDRCDYVSLCKHYRRHVVRGGRFVPLRAKLEASPRAAGLVGAPVIHTGVAHTIHPKSRYYDKEHPEKNRFRRQFRAVAGDLGALRRRGLARAYLHLDGWGVEGYDSHHPDYLPPCPGAGGWSGLRQLAERCARLGYLLALHDQYHDYYHNAASYDPALAVRHADGTSPSHATWYGGPQSLLCARFAPAYVLRNHRALQARGIRVDGSYLDVFAVVPPDECFHPAHRMSRRECLELRARCFAVIRDLEGIVSSEEPVDYAVPHLHLVHHAPFVIAEWLFGGEHKDLALPGAPLWSLVYHDALFVPWSNPVHAALYGGMPYLDLRPADAELAAARRIGRLHARVALEEMVGHEFLSEDRRRQRTTFANGISVTADTGLGTWKAER